WLTGEVLAAQIGYWRETLAGLPPLLPLPIDRPRPQTPSFRGAHVATTLSNTLTAALHAQGRRAGATPFMLLIAGLQALFARLTGEDDLAVGTAIAGRGQVETEDLIGFFVNSLVLRGRLDGDPDLPELLSRVRATALGAYAHQDLPFERLVAESGGADAAEQLGQVRIAVEPAAQDEGVDEKSDQILGLDLPTAGDGGADREVVFAGEAREEGLQAGDEQHERRRSGAAALSVERGGQRVGEGRRNVRAAEGRRLGPRPVDGQRQEGRKTGERFAPVADLCRQHLA